MEISLVKWKEEFYQDFFVQSNDDELYKNMSDAFPKTLDDCRKMVKTFSKCDEQKQIIRAIQINHKIFGCIGAFFEKDIYCKNAEIAYWIGKEMRCKGIMPIVIKRFTNELFKNTDVIRVYARPFGYNKNS